MVAVNSMGTPVARSRHGVALYDNPCPACGKHRLSQKKALGKRCIRCQASVATEASAAKAKQRIGPRLTEHPLHMIWIGMRNRCECPGGSAFHNYGARGIYICAEWRNDFRAFLAWAQSHGYARGLEIDRIDNDGPYAPWNCQWITAAANCRKSRSAKCNEETVRAIKAALAGGQNAASVARSFGFGYQLVRHIKDGHTWRDV